MKHTCFLLIILSILLSGCQSTSYQPYIYETPVQLDDGLETGTLKEADIDSTPIIKAINKILSGKYKEVHSLLIFKEGKLVLEEYFTGHLYQWDGPRHWGDTISWNRNMPHDVKSVSKSITSTCIGIAMDEGFIDHVDQSIFDYLPEYQYLKKDGKENITIEHLVSMTSGLEWDEWHAPLSSAENDIIGLWFNCEDQIECILERPLLSEPGTKFNYSGGNTIVLGEIIKNATGIEIDSFSGKHLFEPLEVDTFFWSIRFPNGTIESAGSLILRPRDMMKVGVTFLDRGMWKGNRIISESWVDNSSIPYANNQGINVPGEASGRLGYSYGWWTKTYQLSNQTINLYTASGWGGQHIMILPEANTVVVFTGGNYLGYRPPFKILEKYILKAI